MSKSNNEMTKAPSKYFTQADLRTERPDWAEKVNSDPRKLAAKRAWVNALAAEYTGEAIMTLAECLKDPDGNIRIKAAQALLDRAWGKPGLAREATAEPEVTNADDLVRRITIEVTGGRQAIDAPANFLAEPSR